ncbi:hypothetical protein V5O48_013843 [Marasmius crinis-equi]|uniref:RTA1-domain-containing protein n=1 Tax=Marasmius crinis-equi TaxID=585013 RepID=A0ABR3EYZ0_9AGAR
MPKLNVVVSAIHLLPTDLDDPDFPFAYCPNLAPAVVFCLLFALSTGLHIYQAIHYRKRFCWVIITAGATETVSFAMRALARYDISPQGFGIPAQVLSQCAPALINAYVYMVFGRLVYYFVPEKRVGKFNARTIARGFVLLDWCIGGLQGAGSAIANIGPGNPDLIPDGNPIKNLNRIGVILFLTGLAFQQLGVLVFSGVAIYVHLKLQDMKNQRDYRPTDWRKIIWPLYGAVSLITDRFVFRLVEFSNYPNTSYSTHETAYYVLDAGAMALCLFMFNLFHPGAVLVGDESEYPKKGRDREQIQSSEEIELAGATARQDVSRTSNANNENEVDRS